MVIFALMGKRPELTDIVKHCEMRFGRGEAAGWKNSDFTDLSRDIRTHTGVVISQSTLKRIFGKVAVDDYYAPQQATIEALNEYGGLAGEAEKVAVTASVPVEQQRVHTLSKRPWLLISVAAIAGIVLLACIGRFLLFSSSKPVYIKLRETEGLLPATAFFNFSQPSGKDSLFVNFGDKSPLLYLKPGETTAAHTYLFPGMFTVELRKGDKIIASEKVYVRSDSWIGLGFHRQRDIPERYYEFPAAKSGKDSLFYMNNVQLKQLGLDTTLPLITRLCNYSPVGHYADDFVFEATFRNVLPEKGIYCRSTQFQVAGLHGMVRFKLVNAGCSLRVLNMMSEQRFEGTKTNLSSFVTDLAQWNTVRLVNRNKNVSLFLNDSLIFTGKYEVSIGDIKGVFLEFEGTGFVKKCELTAADGKKLYRF